MDRLVHLLQSLDTDHCLASSTVLRTLIHIDREIARDIVTEQLTAACARVLGRTDVPSTVPSAMAQLITVGAVYGPVMATRCAGFGGWDWSGPRI